MGVLNGETKEFGATVPSAEYDFFKAMLPQYGSTQWFIRAALHSFNEHMKKHPSLLDMVDKSIEEMLHERRDTASSLNSAGASEPKSG